MKTLIILAVLVAAVAAVPLNQQANEFVINEIESEPRPLDESNWQIIPDGDDNMHLVDVNQQEEIEKSFDAWDGGVRFILYTRNNPLNGQTLILNDAAHLRNTHFNSAWPTRFLIHGWQNDAGSFFNVDLRTAYLNRGNFNVIVVGWGAGAHTSLYTTARARINDVGTITSQMLHFLFVNGINMAQTTLVGHGLGAHAAGMAGKRLLGVRLGSIVGLDPSIQQFSLDNPGARLHITDANYVEIIHTDIGGWGFEQPIGHASFYPNWGRAHPGCVADVFGICAHERSFQFFAQSIASNNRFWATWCAAGWPAILAQSCPSAGVQHLMGGEPVNQGASGVYFLTTNFFSPFAQGPR